MLLIFKMEKMTSKDLLHYHLMFRNIFKDILRPDKTPVSEFEILMVVDEKEGIKVGELSDIMSITRPNLTPLVDNLVSENLIIRKQDKDDKRVTRLYITEQGRKQMQENLEVIKKRCENIREKCTEEELSEIKEYCKKIENILYK